MKKCIFCQKTENEFYNNNCWTEEHIIPESLGNKTLKIYNVCKACNSGLGMYVDNYLVDNMLMKMQRQRLRLPGKNGKIPNAFMEGKNIDGHLMRVDENFIPSIVPYVETKDNTIKVVASSKEEAKRITKKKMHRLNMPKHLVQEALDTIDQKDIEQYSSKIHYDFTIELYRLYLGALKIAFEYSALKLGDKYLEDPRAKKIQEYLKSAIDGKFKDNCEQFDGVRFLNMPRGWDRIDLSIRDKYHFITLKHDTENNLFVIISLFMSPGFSFAVLVSEKASEFCKPGLGLCDIIEVK